MIRVRELLQLDAFAEFELIAGVAGLDRSVTSFAVLDYEIEYGDFSAFIQGEFVLSSLLLMHGLADRAMNAVERLIGRGVAAIAVRVFDEAEVPHEMIDLCEQNDTALFVFRKAYVNDIFIAADNYARTREKHELAARKLSELLCRPGTGTSPASLIREIDPMLLPCCTAAFALCTAEGGEASQKPAMQRLMERYSGAFGQCRRLFLPYENGVLLIISASEHKDAAAAAEAVQTSFADIGLVRASYSVGVGSTASGYEEYALSIAEAMRAARAARILGRDIMKFADAGVYRYIAAAAEDPCAARLCRQAAGALAEYDRANSTELLVTLTEYVKRRGDVRAAAEALFQHPNTVRYRLRKAASLIGIEDDIYEQLFMMMSAYLYSVK